MLEGALLNVFESLGGMFRVKEKGSVIALYFLGNVNFFIMQKIRTISEHESAWGASIESGCSETEKITTRSASSVQNTAAWTLHPSFILPNNC